MAVPPSALRARNALRSEMVNDGPVFSVTGEAGEAPESSALIFR